MRLQQYLFLFNTLDVMKPFLFNNYKSNGVTDLAEITKVAQGTEFDIEVVRAGNDFNRNLGFVRSMVFSVRENLLKEDPKTLPRSRTILKIKTWIYILIKIVLLVKVYYMVMDYAGH
ncbi:hypothetical protein DOY81_014095, partial [Sarcophaga bullata]